MSRGKINADINQFRCVYIVAKATYGLGARPVEADPKMHCEKVLRHAAADFQK